MVMSLPFLAGMAAMIFSILNVSIIQSTTAINARLLVWQLRDQTASNSGVDRPSFDTTNPLALADLANPKAGMVAGTVQQTAAVYVGFGNDREGASPAALISRTWDYRNYQRFEGDAPHFPILADMAIAGWENLESLGQLTDLSLDMFKNALSGLAEKALGAVNQGQDDLDESLEKLKEERKKLVDAINKLKAKLKGLQDKLKGLHDSLKTAKDQLAKALKEQARLVGLGLPIPKTLKDTITTRQELVTTLDRQITELTGQITDLEDSIGKHEQLLSSIGADP